jgi:hypothetical protein
MTRISDDGRARLRRPDPSGWTPAHELARTRSFPRDSDLYELRDLAGVSVAQVARRNGTLPKNFNRWHLLFREDGS